MNRVGMLLLGLIFLAAAGCTSYYRVTDPHTGKIYYTTDLKRTQGGSVMIKDAKSGDEVTIQNSNVEKINKEEYNADLYAPTTNPH